MKPRKDGMYEKKIWIPLPKEFIPSGKSKTIRFNKETNRWEKRTSVYDSDKRILNKNINEIQHQINNGTYVITNKSTLEEVALKWFSVLPVTLEETTKEGYGINMHHAIRLRGHRGIQTFEELDVREMYNEFLEEVDEKGNKKHGSKNSLKHLHFVVNAVFKFAIKQKIRTENPCAELGKEIKVDKFKPYEYKEKEFVDFLNKLTDPEEEVIVSLGGNGLRAGEMAGFKITDIIREERYLNIERSRYRVKGKVGEKKPKSKNGTRKVYAHEYVFDAIDRHLATRDVESEYVLCRSTGLPYRNDEIYHKFVKILDKYGLNKTRLHDLRHYFSTQFARYNVDIKTASEMIGDDPVTVMGIYQHVHEDMKKAAAQKVNTPYKKIKKSGEQTVVKCVVIEEKQESSFATESQLNPLVN